MANVLICCGGTGAHAALAFMRLHALGHPLGFFHHQDGKSLNLPTIYLVDQDNGDGAQQVTAWQALRRVIERHPSRSEWGDATAKEREPGRHVITPLPVGPGMDWFKQSRDRLESRFEGTDYLKLMTSPAQRQIRFSHGMMGSPAVGSLLFKLKTFDRGTDDINNDATFDTLLRQTGRVAVVGSGVGGTGSSVGPTLAQILANQTDTHVMAVMVLNWFRFDDDPNELDSATVRRAQARNRDMIENASSGLKYYGRTLAERVPTVPIGVPETALITRSFTGDTRQPLQEAYPHAVAALCCMLQYLGDKPYAPGLYQMGAADPRRLGGGNHIPGGTLQSMANQAEMLAGTAAVLARVLTAEQEKGHIIPAICRRMAADHRDPRAVGEELGKLAREYRGHMQWMYRDLGVDRQPQQGLTREASVRRRLARSPMRITPESRADNTAGELFRWIAKWVEDEARNNSELNPRATEAGESYWPPVHDPEGLGGAAGEAGKLKKLPAANVTAIIRGFVDPTKISQNGWPDAFAAASYFREAIERTDRVAMRQLELLVAGLVDGRLEIRKTRHGDPRPISLDRIIEEERRKRGQAGLAEYRLVSTESQPGVEQIFGFSSPKTLFCAAPGVPDALWGRLWSQLTGFDADDWNSQSGKSWGKCDTIAGKIHAWVRACRLRNPHTTPPAWTWIFSEVSVPPSARTSFGAGTEIEIDWGGTPVKEFLPTLESGDYRPDAVALPKGDAGAFVAEHGRVLGDSEQVLYEVVPFPIPGEEADKVVRGLWKTHLEHLQAEGKIVTFGSRRKLREVYIVTHLEGSARECIVLSDALVLDRTSIMIDRITPMLQERVPGFDVAQEVLYPDLPLKSDYVGLVLAPGNETALELLKRGEGIHRYQPEMRRGQGGEYAVWSLPVLGRADPLRITLPVPRRESFHKAHWMVWPKFRALNPAWRAYYIYEHCTDPRLCLDTLYLDPDRDKVLKSRNDGQDRLSYPVRYDARDGVHNGGPPVAFTLRDSKADEEMGIYFVSLEKLQEQPQSLRVGVDFGTSHTVGAVSVGKAPADQISLAPELADPGRGLSKHVSQNWEHVTAPAGDLGLLSQSLWMPTYVKGVKPDLRSLLPTELLTIERCDAMTGRSVGTWVPMLDFVIPPVGISRADYVDHVIANFKWDTATAFLGHEMALRKIYLDRIVELFTAEVLDRYGQPNTPIDYTFTYPLRTPGDDVERYVQTLRAVLKRGSASFGCRLQLMDNVGIYDESHATRMGTRVFGQVCMVGDLGGGTLDLIISSHSRPGVEFKEAVDSVKIGGNLLLQTLAREPGGILPEGWASDPEDRATQLVAWMRTLGARRLFGRSEGVAPLIEELNLGGFHSSEKAKRGRELIHRYFYMVSEYMARSLTAYLARQWFPQMEENHWKELRVLLYLRGNGWRLWPESDEYGGIETAIADRVSARMTELWQLVPREGLPDQLRKCSPGGGDGHPKRGPVRRVVGDSQSDAEVRGKWLSYTMVDLRILSTQGDEWIPWYRSIPFRTGGTSVQVQLERVHPPIPLNSPDDARHIQLDGLGRSGEYEVNNWLHRNGDFGGAGLLDFYAPVGAKVWETAFKSALLRKGSKD